MRIVYTLNLILLCACFLHAQESTSAQRAATHQKASFIKVDVPTQSPAAFFQDHHDSFGLSKDDMMIKQKSIKGKSGIKHTKYQQEYKGLKVVGAQYILHSKDGLVEKANGYLAPNIHLDVNPEFDLNKLKEIVSDFVINVIIGNENLLPDIEVSVHETSLCIIDKAFPNFSGDYKLAYQTFAQANTSYPVHEKIYIDANTGEIISNFTEVCDHGVPAKASTRYYGLQDIVTDSVAPNSYVLRDSSRRVFTLQGPDSDSSLDLKYPDFYDDDNYWNNNNSNFNEVAGDAHYCTSSFYDFMNDEFGWKGIDNEGGDLITVVHASRRFYTNAYWNGSRVFVGNGDCDDYGPLTVLDVVGHEFTHGVIDHSCDLVYQDESGALNESIADILGKSLEYKYDQENFNWLIGDKFRVEQDGEKSFRNMKDPNEENDPKFYNGDHWQFGSSDRGGVHSNSGVLNYWFYMLVEGDEGINEVGYEYKVEAIGIDDAIQIVYGCMTGYFVENTNYVNAMLLSLEQTEDMYGLNSQQYKSVKEAWMAVGLYPGINDIDLSVEEVDDEYFGCEDSEIYPRIIVRNSGNLTFEAGKILNLEYQYDALTKQVFEDVVLEQDLLPGDSIFHVFATPVTYFDGIKKDVKFNVLNQDNFMANNSYEADLEFSNLDGSNFKLTSFELRIKDPCSSEQIDQYVIAYVNEGCQPIVKEDSISIKITTDLDEVVFPFGITSQIDPGNSVTAYRDFPQDIQAGFSSFKVEVFFNRDADITDNIYEGSFVIPEGIEGGYLEEFDEPSYSEKLNVNTSSYSGIDSVVIFEGSEMLAITSRRNSFSFEDCMDADDFFEQNNPQTVIVACIDATGLEEPTFGMNIAQLRNGIGAILNEPYRSMVKVSTDSTSYPIIFDQENGKVIAHEFPLPVGYTGSLMIEVFTYAGDRDAFTEVPLENLDAVLLDRLELYEKDERPNPMTLDIYQVYPTLVEDQIQVLPPDTNEPYQFMVYDILGRLLFVDSFIGNQSISLKNIPSGSYFYQVRENTFPIKSGKFVKVQ